MCESLVGFFAGISTQITTITYFENTIYHHLLALNWSISTSVAHTNWKYYRILMKHSGRYCTSAIYYAGQKAHETYLVVG